jgi:hypothetical protein
MAEASTSSQSVPVWKKMGGYLFNISVKSDEDLTKKGTSRDELISNVRAMIEGGEICCENDEIVKGNEALHKNTANTLLRAIKQCSKNRFVLASRQLSSLFLDLINREQKTINDIPICSTASKTLGHQRKTITNSLVLCAHVFAAVPDIEVRDKLSLAIKIMLTDESKEFTDLKEAAITYEGFNLLNYLEMIHGESKIFLDNQNGLTEQETGMLETINRNLRESWRAISPKYQEHLGGNLKKKQKGVGEHVHIIGGDSELKRRSGEIERSVKNSDKEMLQHERIIGFEQDRLRTSILLQRPTDPSLKTLPSLEDIGPNLVDSRNKFYEQIDHEESFNFGDWKFESFAHSKQGAVSAERNESLSLEKEVPYTDSKQERPNSNKTGIPDLEERKPNRTILEALQRNLSGRKYGEVLGTASSSQHAPLPGTVSPEKRIPVTPETENSPLRNFDESTGVDNFDDISTVSERSLGSPQIRSIPTSSPRRSGFSGWCEKFLNTILCRGKK